jgi:hypothetical protein
MLRRRECYSGGEHVSTGMTRLVFLTLSHLKRFMTPNSKSKSIDIDKDPYSSSSAG